MKVIDVKITVVVSATFDVGRLRLRKKKKQKKQKDEQISGAEPLQNVLSYLTYLTG